MSPADYAAKLSMRLLMDFRERLIHGKLWTDQWTDRPSRANPARIDVNAVKKHSFLMTVPVKTRSNQTAPSFSLHSVSDVEGELTLTVVISAGQVRDAETRVRELAVFLRNIEPAQIEDGVLVIRENGASGVEDEEIRIKDRIVQQTQRSVRLFTNVKFEQTNWTAWDHPTGNLSYCCELHVNGTTVASGCLRLQPRWMETMLSEIGGLPLYDVAIPGTHQSGTYNAELDYQGRYRDCQEEDVFTQLLYGIRALDLRPGAVVGKQSPYHGYEYWIFHDMFSTRNLLKPILGDIKSFLDAHRKEVVIVDFHEFPRGFDTNAAYLGLEELVEEVLGDHIFRRNETNPATASLGQVIDLGKRAILTFQKNEYLQDKFFPGVQHLWANTDNIAVLREKLKQGQTSRYPHRFYSSMAQTTAQGAWSVILDRYRGGVRGLAHRDNFEISSWYAEDKRIRENANIIAMDYFASSDIVDVCQAINLERTGRPS